MIHRIKVRQHNAQGDSEILIDGVDHAHMIDQYQIGYSADDGPVLWISFSPAVLPEFDGEAELVLSEDLSAALVALGWTPPAKGKVA